jgi:hypothetical protein
LNVPDENGAMNSVVVFSNLGAGINVRPLKYVTLQIAAPANRETVYVLNPILTRTPLTIRVMAFDANNDLVDLSAAAGGTDQPLTLELRNGDNQDITEGARLTEVGKGVYQYTRESPSTGAMSITVKGAVPLTVNDYAYARNGGDTANVVIDLAINPLIYLEIVGLVLFLIVLIVAVVTYVRYLRDQVPPQGIILFQAEIQIDLGPADVEDLQTVDLGEARLSKYKVRPGKKLLEYVPNLRSIEIATLPAKTLDARREQASQGIVQMTVKFRDHTATIVRELRPGSIASIARNPARGAEVMAVKDADLA